MTPEVEAIYNRGMWLQAEIRRLERDSWGIVHNWVAGEIGNSQWTLLKAMAYLEDSGGPARARTGVTGDHPSPEDRYGFPLTSTEDRGRVES